ncbi:HEAT repeat protein [Crossiella equi]|uniref:HEAT repeat protein n=1 Tax=Crossiella equi TaxID=130796 RepID=A0ABS5AQG8_9PSEU|nr:hypothetical protein [Crossiella equi]MBP2478814.1 HEAT repeat protein [Crossiella equi]
MGENDWAALARRCTSRSARRARTALEEITSNLLGQNGWECSAALPFLLDLAGNPAVRHRCEVVQLLGYVAREAVAPEVGFVDDGWEAALAAERSRVLALLADPDPLVRREVTVLVAEWVRHPDSVVALRERWRVEADRVTRWDLALAVGAALTWQPGEDLRAELTAVLGHPDLQLRLAAVHALARTEPAVAGRELATLLEAVRDPELVLWRGSAWLGLRPEVMVEHTAELLAEDSAEAAAFALRTDRVRAGHSRRFWLARAQRVAAEWPGATGELLPVLGECLGDQVPGVRFHAAALLACLGAAAPHTEALAGLAEDASVRDPQRRHTVGDAAVWALARLGDTRCVPGLVERLTGDRLGFDHHRAHPPRTAYLEVLPGIADVLIPLRPNAEALLDAVAARLADRAAVPGLCAVLAAWGPVAEPVLPALAAHLPEEDLAAPVAAVLGAVGPPAADLARALRHRAAVPAVAHALWRTGADPDLGLAELVRHADDHRALALLGELGPAAAPAIGAVRAALSAAEEPTRVAAAHALWRITGEPERTVAVLTEVAAPLALGECGPAHLTALQHLANVGADTERVRALARSVVASPRRVAWSGGWRTFEQDERFRAAAYRILGR